MRMRATFIGAALGIAVSANTAMAAGGLFGFGQSQPTVDPEAVQAMSDRLQVLETDVVSLTAQVQELTFIVQQLQGQLKIAGIAPPASLPPVAALPGTPQLVAPTIGPATTVPSAPARPPQVAANTPPPLLPPATIGPVPVPSQSQIGVGTGARLGNGQSDAAPSLGGQPLDLSALGKGTTGSIGPAPVTPVAPAIAATPSPAPAAGAPAPAAGVQTAALTPSGNPKADYDLSYAFITAGKYDLAETSFRNYLAAYPKSDLAGDAQFWLGQSLFQRARYADASTVFRTGYSSYPKSAKAPEMLLALGQSLAGLGQRDEACQIYSAALKQHPTMPAALKQRVITEQASAACPG